MRNIDIPSDGEIKISFEAEDNYLCSAYPDGFFDNFRLQRLSPVVFQENHYDPYGLNLKGIEENDAQTQQNVSENRMQYNGKEKTEDFSLMYNDHGARNLCLQTGRWTGVDELAHKYWETSPFVSMGNNPIKFVDLDGRSIADFFDENGNKIGTDGNEKDKSKYLVTDKKEVKQIRKSHKQNQNTNLSDIKSKRKLVSDAALKECLDVYKRTIAPTNDDADGGLHGESSFVLKDRTVVRGEASKKAYIITDEKGNKFIQADEKLPDLPKGTNLSDVEAMIHSHIFGKLEEGNQVFSHNSEKSQTDTGTFKQFSTNIIVGPFENVKAQEIQGGGKSFTKPKIGITVYGAMGSPKYKLSIEAVKKIVGEK